MAGSVLEVRLTLAANGYTPIPLHGKAPSLASWQTVQDVSREQAVMWEKSWPDARNTGVLTASMPTLDLDIMDAAAVEAIVLYVRDKFEERGYVPARVGRAPRTALPFRTLDPFAKYSVDLIAANGDTSQKVEFLAQGQQVVVDGIHPDTRQPYTWQGGSPLEIALEELAYISADGARQLLDEVVEILVRDFGYRRAKGRPRKTGNGGNAVGGTEDWGHLIDNIHAGRNLHASLRDLAAKLIRSGMKGGAAVNFLRSQLEGSTAPHDERWQDRYDNIPRLVDSAEQKYTPPKDDDATAGATIAPNLPAIAPAAGNAGAGGTPPPPPPPPGTGTGSPSSAAGSALPPIEETLQTFERWLHLPNRTPVYAMLGTVAANLLPGDPVWLGLVAPPSSAKTELLNALTGLPFVVSASTLTLAELAVGHAAAATGARRARRIAAPGRQPRHALSQGLHFNIDHATREQGRGLIRVTGNL